MVDVVDGKVVPKLVKFNYFKLLHPLTPKEVRQNLGAAKIDPNDDKFGSSGGGTTSHGDETVPF
jgi:hypothetical protein